MKRATILAILFAPVFMFGQKFQDVSVAGCPVSLSIQKDSTDVLAVAHNNSTKGILAMLSTYRTTDNHGQVVPGFSRMDSVFKSGPLHSQQERPVMLLNTSEPDSKVVRSEGAVLFVQFEDGTRWGDPQAAKDMLAQRPAKFAYLSHLVELYDTEGNKAFMAALNDSKLTRPLYSVAGCLKADAEYEHIPIIDLARKRLAAAESWHTYGIF